MRFWIGSALCALCVIMLAGIALADPAALGFDPRDHKGPQHGNPNQVMVLGTPHLSYWRKGFDPAILAPLTDRIAHWQPQAIAVEDMSGAQCAFVRQYPDRYTETYETYCWNPDAATKATGLIVPQANAEMDRELANWPDHPTPAQRRHLASVMLAAGEPASALVQWLRLAPDERHAGDGLTPELVQALEHQRTRQNEVTLIAAPLAAQLGLERLYAMDDHTADAPVPNEKAYEAAIQAAWQNPALERRKARDAKFTAHLDTGEEVLALYRDYNAPDQGALIHASDFGAALEEPTGYGRYYVGWWEVRNLRMAANIRAIFANHPGERVLVIVGASHKPYLDAYLDEMTDMRVGNVETVLTGTTQ